MPGGWLAAWRWVPLLVAMTYAAAPLLFRGQPVGILLIVWVATPVIAATLNWVALDVYFGGRRFKWTGRLWPFSRSQEALAAWRTIYVWLSVPFSIAVWLEFTGLVVMTTSAMPVFALLFGPVALSAWNLALLGRFMNSPSQPVPPPHA